MENNEPNFEINLLPFISLLAVCISFLLLTAVWLPVGTLDIKQAMGETSENKEEPSRFAISMLNENLYEVSVEQKGKEIKNLKVRIDSEDNIEMTAVMQKLQQTYQDINMAFIRPSPGIKYNNLIDLLSLLKKLELKEIGIEPMM